MSNIHIARNTQFPIPSLTEKKIKPILVEIMGEILLENSVLMYNQNPSFLKILEKSYKEKARKNLRSRPLIA